jgi:hypothetical protein
MANSPRSFSECQLQSRVTLKPIRRPLGNPINSVLFGYINTYQLLDFLVSPNGINDPAQAGIKLARGENRCGFKHDASPERQEQRYAPSPISTIGTVAMIVGDNQSE